MSKSPSRTFRESLRAVMANYGMVFVLLFLMLVFSLLTIKEQRATGRDAGTQVADQIVTQFGTGARVFIAVPASEDDRAFAAAIEESIQAAGERFSVVSLEHLQKQGKSWISCSLLKPDWMLSPRPEHPPNGKSGLASLNSQLKCLQFLAPDAGPVF